MSALRLAERLIKRAKERTKENHKEMDKGKSNDEYHRLVGKNQELRWMQNECKEFLAQIEREEDLDD